MTDKIFDSLSHASKRRIRVSTFHVDRRTNAGDSCWWAGHVGDAHWDSQRR